MREVRCPIGERRGHVDNCDVESSRSFGVVGRFVAAAGQCRCDIATGDVFDMRFAGGQTFDPHLVEVEADHVETDLHRPHGNRKPGVALTDDNHAIHYWCGH